MCRGGGVCSVICRLVIWWCYVDGFVLGYLAMGAGFVFGCCVGCCT